MSEPMISIDRLTKSYGDTQALKGISFEVPRGQVVGFLGPNGAGKSTTMKVLTGFVRASGGSVNVGGLSVDDAPIETKKKIGYLPESNPLYDDMMVNDYLEWVSEVRGIKKGERAAAIDRAVKRCGLSPVRGKNISELSKGYRQRVGLAQAIVHDPDLLILDEPTTGLDPNQVLEIRALIKELGEEKTVLMSTHIMQEVQATCSRVVIINKGEIVADGTPDALANDALKNEVGALSIVIAPRGDAKDYATLLRQIAGVSDVEIGDAKEEGTFAFVLRTQSDVRKALFDCAVDNEFYLYGLERRTVSLEDTFRKLTQTES